MRIYLLLLMVTSSVIAQVIPRNLSSLRYVSPQGDSIYITETGSVAGIGAKDACDKNGPCPVYGLALRYLDPKTGKERLVYDPLKSKSSLISVSLSGPAPHALKKGEPNPVTAAVRTADGAWQWKLEFTFVENGIQVKPTVPKRATKQGAGRRPVSGRDRGVFAFASRNSRTCTGELNGSVAAMDCLWATPMYMIICQPSDCAPPERFAEPARFNMSDGKSRTVKMVATDARADLLTLVRGVSFFAVQDLQAFLFR